VKIKLDSNACTGHGRCFMVAPEVYDEDERSHCVLLFEDVPPEHEEAALKGVNACPEQALTIVSA